MYAVAAFGALDVLLEWAPERMDRAQLRRERHAASMALLLRWSTACLLVAAILGIVGIAVVWHPLVPGAMCGTGVLQAMGATGSRAMIFWAVTLIILYAWHVLEKLNRSHPQAPLTQSATRVMITAAPFLSLAIFYSWQALMHGDTAPPVSCCAAVYDQVLRRSFESTANRQMASLSLWGSLTGTVVLLLLAGLKIRSPGRGPSAIIPVAAATWLPMSSLAVKKVWSAYYFQVLSHPCPWCLFLPDYGGAGFFIFGSMALVFMESMAIGLSEFTRRRVPLLAEASDKRIRRAAWTIVGALVGFILLTAGQAILWRLRTGIWFMG